MLDLMNNNAFLNPILNPNLKLGPRIEHGNSTTIPMPSVSDLLSNPVLKGPIRISPPREELEKKSYWDMYKLAVQKNVPTSLKEWANPFNIIGGTLWDFNSMARKQAEHEFAEHDYNFSSRTHEYQEKTSDILGVTRPSTGGVLDNWSFTDLGKAGTIGLFAVGAIILLSWGKK